MSKAHFAASDAKHAPKDKHEPNQNEAELPEALDPKDKTSFDLPELDSYLERWGMSGLTNKKVRHEAAIS